MAYFYLKAGIIIAPKTILILNVLILSVFLCIWRYAVYNVLRNKNLREKIIIIDFKPGLEELANGHFSFRAGYEILAFFATNKFSLEKFTVFADMAKYGVISNIDDLKEIMKKERVTSVVFPRFSEGNEELVHQIFANFPLRLNYISFANFYENLTKKVALEAINEFWFLENVSKMERRIDDILKRGFDALFSSLGILILIILFPFIALAIKLDSKGPVFYVQKRMGKDSRAFLIYKFRTMQADAEKNGPQWARLNDPRITKVGKILRRLYLDELPQFLNILRGDFSFVGPRPERPEFVEQLKKEIPYYEIRHLIKPGFTGWAQINYHYGASIDEAKEKFKYDLYYIKNRNFFMDLGIILKTVRIIFK
jgi:exopolysaccharide biosynthesis polyprenyl glycosylphosphotransferase